MNKNWWVGKFHFYPIGEINNFQLGATEVMYIEKRRMLR